MQELLAKLLFDLPPTFWLAVGYALLSAISVLPLKVFGKDMGGFSRFMLIVAAGVIGVTSYFAPHPATVVAYFVAAVILVVGCCFVGSAFKEQGKASPEELKGYFGKRLIFVAGALFSFALLIKSLLYDSNSTFKPLDVTENTTWALATTFAACWIIMTARAALYHHWGVNRRRI